MLSRASVVLLLVLLDYGDSANCPAGTSGNVETTCAKR
jgi:hypothetical protein